MDQGNNSSDETNNDVCDKLRCFTFQGHLLWRYFSPTIICIMY